MYNNLIFRSIKRISLIIPAGYGKNAILLFLGICINSFSEIIGLASLLPLLAAILKPNFIQENKFLLEFYKITGIQNEKYFILFLSILILAFILLKNLFGLLLQKKQASFCWNLHEKISIQILKNIYKKGFLFFSNQNSNIILNRVSSVPSQFAQIFLINLFLFLNEFIILVIILSSLLVYDYKVLVILALIIIPVFGFFYKASKVRISEYSERINDLSPEISKSIYELVFGYVDVAISGIFNDFSKHYQNAIQEAKNLRIQLIVIQQIPNRLIEVCVILAVLTMLLYGVFWLENNESIIIMISIFGLAAYRIIPSINRLMLSLVHIKGQQYSLDILEEFLSNSIEKVTPEQPFHLPFEEKVTLNNVSFSFPESQDDVLKNIDFSFNKGSSIGIIGASGSGKTTLMNLMLGLLTPTSGQLKIDQIILEGDNVAAWQKKCGYVRQDVFLIDGTLAENIAFGIKETNIDYDKMNHVIRQAHLDSWITQLPNGIHSSIGERGTRISGGQRQRVGIARALYHGAEILFFDEATSALDSKTEKEITESIKELQNQKITLVIIAHRESTLKYCDTIINIENGMIKKN